MKFVRCASVQERRRRGPNLAQGGASKSHSECCATLGPYDTVPVNPEGVARICEATETLFLGGTLLGFPDSLIPFPRVSRYSLELITAPPWANFGSPHWGSKPEMNLGKFKPAARLISIKDGVRTTNCSHVAAATSC